MPVIALFAGGFALALLVVIYWRTAQRYEVLQGEVDRLRVVQRDMSSDVRARLDQGEQAWEKEMRPRFERLEAVEGRVTEAEAELRAALAGSEEKASERNERIESAVRTLRNAADARLADLSARLSQVETDAPEASADAEEEDETGPEEPHIDFEVIADDALAGGDPVPAPPSAAGATSDDDRGTPMDVAVTADEASSGRWVVVLLALVAGIALLVTTLA